MAADRKSTWSYCQLWGEIQVEGFFRCGCIPCMAFPKSRDFCLGQVLDTCFPLS